MTAKQIIGWEATKEGAEYGVHAYTVELVDDSMALTAGERPFRWVMGTMKCVLCGQ